MIAVIFEGEPHEGQSQTYLDAAARLRPILEKIDGFVSIERFQSLTNPGKLLSLSYWRDEEAVKAWRNQGAHRLTQEQGRNGVFAGYSINVAQVLRRYGMNDREGAPADSRAVHG
jgi:heme-degrading monooxygenase HmoA